jgi:hypothetical protein
LAFEDWLWSRRRTCPKPVLQASQTQMGSEAPNQATLTAIQAADWPCPSVVAPAKWSSWGPDTALKPNLSDCARRCQPPPPHQRRQVAVWWSLDRFCRHGNYESSPRLRVASPYLQSLFFSFLPLRVCFSFSQSVCFTGYLDALISLPLIHCLLIPRYSPDPQSRSTLLYHSFLNQVHFQFAI